MFFKSLSVGIFSRGYVWWMTSLKNLYNPKVWAVTTYAGSLGLIPSAGRKKR